MPKGLLRTAKKQTDKHINVHREKHKISIRNMVTTSFLVQHLTLTVPGLKNNQGTNYNRETTAHNKRDKSQYGSLFWLCGEFQK